MAKKKQLPGTISAHQAVGEYMAKEPARKWGQWKLTVDRGGLAHPIRVPLLL